MQYFSQICTEEFIEVPSTHPDIGQVVSIVADCDVVSLKVINTMKGQSYEGQCLTGKKLAAEIRLRQKILYVAGKDNPSVHILENDFFKCAYIVIPCLIEGTDPEFLTKHKMLQCKVEVEDVSFKSIEKRKAFINLCLTVKALLSPAHELCCAMHQNCKYSDVYMMHGDGTHASRIICREDGKNRKPLWSPLGREIAFLSDHESGRMLNIYSLKTCSSRRLLETAKLGPMGSYCWSTDGTRLIFSGRVDGGREIFSVCSNDSDLKQLTAGKGMYESCKPKCSPCGRRIAFTRSAAGLADIWVMNLDGLDCRKLTASGSVKQFDWSPDGKNIVYIIGRNGKPDRLHLIDMESSKNKELCIDGPLPRKKKVRFSPEGTSFAFIGSQLDTEDIYVYDLQENKLDNLTKNSDNVKVSGFVWSADSDRIYFTADDLFYWNVYLVSLEDGQKYQLTNTTASKIELSYRPKMC